MGPRVQPAEILFPGTLITLYLILRSVRMGGTTKSPLGTTSDSKDRVQYAPVTWADIYRSCSKLTVFTQIFEDFRYLAYPIPPRGWGGVPKPFVLKPKNAKSYVLKTYGPALWFVLRVGKMVE